MADLRTALVTGANRGIGLEIAKGLSERGMLVIAAARTKASADDATGRIGGNAVGVALPLDAVDALESAADQVLRKHGQIDILVNNAGVLHQGTVQTVTSDAIIESMTVNTIAPFILTKIFGGAMASRGRGRVVNVSSGWGAFDDGLTGPSAYSVSKAALNALTVSAAQSFGPRVKVNAACPGWVRTRMGGSMASRSPAEGADTPLWLATLDDDGPTGGFFRDRRLIEW